MIKVIIIVLILIIIMLITYSLCVAAKRGDQYPEECRYNILTGCKGKCCKSCELDNMCKLACEDNPEKCGGKIKY